MPTASETSRAYALLLVMPLFFSSNLVIGRAVIEEVQPWTLACLRWTLAALILLPFTARSLVEHRKALFAAWERLWILGALGMWICGAIVFLSLTATTATNATLIYTTSPVIVILIEAALGKRPPFSRLAGVAMALLGVAIIVLRGDLSALARLDFNLGDLGIGAAAIAWAIYSLVLKHQSLANIPTLTLFTAIMIAGVVGLFPFMIWESLALGVFPTSLSAWTAIVALAIFPSVGAFSIYQYGVKVVGPAITACFLYLLPPYGVGMAILFLGESFRPHHALGSILVLAGLVAATAPADVLGEIKRRLGLVREPESR